MNGTRPCPARECGAQARLLRTDVVIMGIIVIGIFAFFTNSGSRCNISAIGLNR